MSGQWDRITERLHRGTGHEVKAFSRNGTADVQRRVVLPAH
jgi:hypothetical protein